MTLRFACLLLFCALAFATSAQQSKNAQELFELLRDRVYQVRVIDIASGDKYSIGSGFQVFETSIRVFDRFQPGGFRDAEPVPNRALGIGR